MVRLLEAGESMRAVGIQALKRCCLMSWLINCRDDKFRINKFYLMLGPSLRLVISAVYLQYRRVPWMKTKPDKWLQSASRVPTIRPSVVSNHALQP